MSSSWFDLLSSVDTMVVGSIVGSVILAFVLVVAVFSLKIKALQDHLEEMKETIAERDHRIQSDQEKLTIAHREASDSQTIMEHFQRQEKLLIKETMVLRKELKEAQEEAKRLRLETTRLSEEKHALEKTIETFRDDLNQADSEVEAARKRNEFWIAQIAELRTKHEALKHKLTMQEERTK